MAYADRQRLPDDIAELLWQVISRIDTADMQWRAEQLEARTNGNGIQDSGGR